MSRIIDAKPEDNDDEYTVKVNLSSHYNKVAVANINKNVAKSNKTVAGDVEPVPLGSNVHCCRGDTADCAQGGSSDIAKALYSAAGGSGVPTCIGESCSSLISKEGEDACQIGGISAAYYIA